MEFLLIDKKILLGLLSSIILAMVMSKLRGKRLKLPPTPLLPLPIFGNWLQIGNDLNHDKLRGFAKKLGDIFLVKMGQCNIVVVSSLDLAKQVLHTQGMEFGSRTRTAVMDIFTGYGQDMVSAQYGEHWRKMRKIATVAFFSTNVVQQYRKAWEEEVEEVIKDVKKNPKAPTEGTVLRTRLQLMMYNNVYRVMFNKRFESEDDPLYNKLKILNEDTSRLAQSIDHSFGDFIPILKPFLRGYLKICKDVRERRLQLLKDYFVDERRKLLHTKSIDTESQKCGIDHVLESQQSGEINEDHVLFIVENMNLVAIGPPLWSIEWAIAELINHPNIQTKLRDEMDSMLGPGVPVTEPDTHKLPYLQAVIKETLRFRMVAPFLVPHMNVNDEKLGGYDIPAKSKISVNAWWLANNPEHWKKPEEFRPERFLEEEINVDPIGNDFRYIPFGVGRRSCPGIFMAMSCLGITLGRLVQEFDLLPNPGQFKIDTTTIGKQVASRIFTQSTVVLKPRFQ